MKRFITTTLFTSTINMLVIDAINMIIGFPMTEIAVVAWGFASALIGVGLAFAIRYAINLAKEHKV
jgi:hypothetical protein